ncbi:GNAT family N-acetyltransferase [Pseudoroseicyclus sp. CLL3-39]|uniref:GNAT family N-acetyltransferase n=2 Tax=Pseudoroseicyclus tamaricis TaxID=2705421 RepID=A0A6B2K0J6_9RHOB|nr:GNAT family N-acetyltransferase [Pseudoroseicyclus tamaricis]
MGQLTFRPARAGDMPLLQAIRAAAFAPIFASFRALTGPAIAEVALATAEADQKAELARLFSAGSPEELIVTRLGSATIGFLTLALNETSRIGEIGLNAVDPAYAGRGFGTQMYRWALAEMAARGMTVATVGTGGDASHAPARRAYEKAGFGPHLPAIWYYAKL